MINKVQLTAQIRFAIEQLSERNAQHEWEHLCRHLARERVCANILPATGPVQSGGDQGRDFETFRTYLQQSSLKERSFVGLVSDVPLAFACTLEKQIASKIRRDVKTIMGSGTSVKGIYIFCTQGVPVAKRHELEAWALQDYKVELEILDGLAIAELLGDRSLFWLAERYLHLPAEILLPFTAENEELDWYTRTLEKWRRSTRSAQTFADFSEIRSAGRIALGSFIYDDDGKPINRHIKPELPFWIERLDEIANLDTLPWLRHRAFYEASVLRLRGLGSLIGQEERLRLYFATLPELVDTAELEDAEVLLSYVVPANVKGEVDLTENEMSTWIWALQQHLETRIKDAQKHERRNEWCALLEIRGHLALLHHLKERNVDATETLQFWNKLAKVAAFAPLFPIERFADRLAEFARYIGSHPEYDSLVRQIDELVAERFGQFKTAEKCLHRAEAFHATGDLPRAIAQLHQAKIDWFAKETLDHALHALHWLNLVYVEQGLFLAAKYYALVSAYLILHSEDLRLKPALALSLERAASNDFGVGAWFGFLDLSEACSIFYPHFTNDPDADFEVPEGMLQRLIFHLSILLAATKMLVPEAHAGIAERCKLIAQRMGLESVLQETYNHAQKVWGEQRKEELWKKMEEQLAGSPWSDMGSVRKIQWKAHGITWNIEWKNNYETTLAAEEFLSALQIFLSDLAGYELCLMRSTLDLSIQLGSTGNGVGIKADKLFNTRFEDSNTKRRATITLPSYEHFRDGTLSHEELQVGMLQVAIRLLEDVSLLKEESFKEILTARFKQGLPNKLSYGALYSQCYSAFFRREDYDVSERTTMPVLDVPNDFVSLLPDNMPWRDGDGPTYDLAKSHTMIQNRYNNITEKLPYTLQTLVKDPNFQELVVRLHEQGWKDWHILSMIFNITMNYRMNHQRIRPSSPEMARAMGQRIMKQQETEMTPLVPLEEYTEKNFKQQLPIYMSSFAKNFDLEIHQLTPDLAGIEEFLTVRYHFWQDDIPHPDPFHFE
jgi:hypothetical protein